MRIPRAHHDSLDYSRIISSALDDFFLNHLSSLDYVPRSSVYLLSLYFFSPTTCSFTRTSSLPRNSSLTCSSSPTCPSSPTPKPIPPSQTSPAPLSKGPTVYHSHQPPQTHNKVSQHTFIKNPPVVSPQKSFCKQATTKSTNATRKLSLRS